MKPLQRLSVQAGQRRLRRAAAGLLRGGAAGGSSGEDGAGEGGLVYQRIYGLTMFNQYITYIYTYIHIYVHSMGISIMCIMCIYDVYLTLFNQTGRRHFDKPSVIALDTINQQD